MAVVANCGDSRLLTDDGSNYFRQVTRDHRPDEPMEQQRLEEFVQRGEATLERLDTWRVYPGGLAVSRTLGDVTYSPAAEPTPDVYRIPLSQPLFSLDSKDDGCDAPNRTIRFILASDGLWDVMSNHAVGSFGARNDSNGLHRPPAAAVDAILAECLRRTGGRHDDTTVLVVDVEVPC